MDKDTKKELTVGATNAGTAAVAAAASVGALSAAALAGLGTMVTLVYTYFLGRDQRRSENLFTRMAEADEDPEDFLAEIEQRLRDGDDEELAKLRALLRADLEAVSSEATRPIAAIGRDYVRGVCPAWAARGWVRLLSEASSHEIDTLRLLATATRASLAAGDLFQAQHQPELREVDSWGVALVLSARVVGAADGDPARFESVQAFPTPGSLGVTSNEPVAAVSNAYVPRLFDLLLQHGVASTRAPRAETLRGSPPKPAVEMPHASAAALVRAFCASV